MSVAVRHDKTGQRGLTVTVTVLFITPHLLTTPLRIVILSRFNARNPW